LTVDDDIVDEGTADEERRHAGLVIQEQHVSWGATGSTGGVADKFHSIGLFPITKEMIGVYIKGFLNFARKGMNRRQSSPAVRSADFAEAANRSCERMRARPFFR
jgi:hypothetical protein